MQYLFFSTLFYFHTSFFCIVHKIIGVLINLATKSNISNKTTNDKLTHLAKLKPKRVHMISLNNIHPEEEKSDQHTCYYEIKLIDESGKKIAHEILESSLSDEIKVSYMSEASKMVIINVSMMW